MERHVRINKDYWDGVAKHWAQGGAAAWASDHQQWGNWQNRAVQLLPKDMSGLDAVELGCGTGYVSAWMARRGARVTGIDVSPEQLATARRLSAEHKLNITWIEGDAEITGLPDESFDFAISEYGAAIWCRPEVWLKEAWRILRKGSTCVFLGNHPLALITTPLNGAPNDLSLHRPYRDMRAFDWTEVEFDPAGISYALTFADWSKLFNAIGFQIKAIDELYAPQNAEGVTHSVPAKWAQTYPTELVWTLQKP